MWSLPKDGQDRLLELGSAEFNAIIEPHIEQTVCEKYAFYESYLVDKAIVMQLAMECFCKGVEFGQDVRPLTVDGDLDLHEFEISHRAEQLLEDFDENQQTMGFAE